MSQPKKLGKGGQDAGQPGQAQPMAVTLGHGKNQAQAAQMQNKPSDVQMEDASDPARQDASKARAATPAGGSINMAQVVETIEVNGEVPMARFGHTITIVSKSKVVLFGGATGDTGKYSMTGETFMYNILNKAWQKLQGK